MATVEDPATQIYKMKLPYTPRPIAAIKEIASTINEQSLSEKTISFGLGLLSLSVIIMAILGIIYLFKVNITGTFNVVIGVFIAGLIVMLIGIIWTGWKDAVNYMKKHIQVFIFAFVAITTGVICVLVYNATRSFGEGLSIALTIIAGILTFFGSGALLLYGANNVGLLNLID